MPKHAKGRGKTAEKAAFLLCLSHTGNVTISAEFVGMSRASVYKWRAADLNFRLQWDEASCEAADRLGDAAWQRAVKGVDVPVFYQGEQIGIRRHFSDRLLVHLIQISLAKQEKGLAKSVPDQNTLYAEFEAKLTALIAADKC